MSTTSSKNFTTLYSGSGSVVPQGAYGNANVVALLAVGTDGGNTVGNIVAAGNITAPSIGYNGLSEIEFSPIAAGPIYLSAATNAATYPQVTINDGIGTDATVVIRNTLEVVGTITTDVVESNTIVNTGNITTGGYFIGDFLGNIGGNITAAGSNTQVQFNDSGLLGAAAGLTFNKTSNALGVTGNITGGNVAGTTVSGTALTASGNVTGGNVNTGGVVSATGNVRGANLNTTGAVSATGNITGGNILTVGAVSATGNVTGNYILGNGSQLTGLPATYANANVVSLLANFGSNTISTTGNITSGNFVTGGNLYGNVVGQTFAGVGTANVDIRQYSTGSGNALNLIANLVVLGAGSSATNTLVAPVGSSLELGSSRDVAAGGYIKLWTSVGQSGNAEIAGWNNGSSAGVNLYGNTHIGAGPVGIGTAASKGNLIVANAVYVGESISATGNITGNYILGNGSQLTGLPATYGNANVADFLANGFGANTVSTTGNITAGYFVGNGSALTSLTGANVSGTVANATYATSAGSATTANTVTDAAQANITSVGTLTSLSVSGNISTLGTIFQNSFATALQAVGNITTTTSMSAGGNVIGGNLITGNLTITPNVGQIGNVIINTTQPYVVQTNNSNIVPQQSRIVVGNGWDGNYSALYDPLNRSRVPKLAVWEKIDRTDTAGAGSTALVVNLHQQRFMNGNVTTASSRNFSVVNTFNVGGGPAANVSTVTSPAAFVGMNGVLAVGNVSPAAGSPPQASLANVGDVTLAAGTAGLFLVQAYANSSLTTSYGAVAGTFPGGSETRITNVINYSGWNVNNGSGTANVTPTNFVGYYHASASSSLGAVSTFDAYRAAPNYYAFRNDDDVAQVKLGSLRSYHELQYSTATSGTVNIDKTNAQVQLIAPTANVTIGSFLNFVTTASNSVSSINQTDTVTLIVKQGATPYTVTMPTGNAAIKYASGNSTVGSTANAVTMISITGSNVGGSALYMVTVSPEFT